MIATNSTNIECNGGGGRGGGGERHKMDMKYK